MSTTTDRSEQVRDLESVLRQKFGARLKLIDVSVGSLVAKGENFSGSLLDIVTKVQRGGDDSSEIEELRFVGKGSVYSPVINWTVLMKKEIFMYTDILPLYAAIEEENGIGDEDNVRHMFPYLCGHRLSLEPGKDEADEDALILLENIKVQGYYVLDKKIGLDFAHASEALKALARFHALGIAAKRQQPSKFDEFIEQSAKFGYYVDEETSEYYGRCFLKSFKRLAKHAKYQDRVERIVRKRLLEGSSQARARHDLWSSIIHFDYWTNNVMFRDGEDSGITLKIIDFQAYAYADVCLDLYYFMCTSLERDAMFERFDELLDVYYEAFVATLKRVNVDVDGYSRDKFDAVLKEDAWFEFFHCAFALSFFTCEQDEGSDKNEHLEKILAFKGGDLYLRKLEDLIVLYDRRGWLD